MNDPCRLVPLQSSAFLILLSTHFPLFRIGIVLRLVQTGRGCLLSSGRVIALFSPCFYVNKSLESMAVKFKTLQNWMGVKSYILYGNPQKERARGTKKKSVGISRICDVNTYPTDPTDFFWSPSRKTFLETCIKYISLYPHLEKILNPCAEKWRSNDKISYAQVFIRINFSIENQKI